MAINYRVSNGPRAKSSVNNAAQNRIVSADGNRWAIARFRKCSLGGGRYDIVLSWKLVERVNGKAVTVHNDAYEDRAREFVGVAA